MTDPTERLAKAVEEWIVDHHADNDRIDSLAVRALCASLAAQGVGHREDHVPAFAQHLDRANCVVNGVAEELFKAAATEYLASLAAKEEER